MVWPNRAHIIERNRCVPAIIYTWLKLSKSSAAQLLVYRYPGIAGGFMWFPLSLAIGFRNVLSPNNAYVYDLGKMLYVKYCSYNVTSAASSYLPAQFSCKVSSAVYKY